MDATHSPVLEPIQEMTRRLVDGFHPVRIILFGSYARGEATPDSDADLLVILPVSGSRRKLATEMERAVAGCGLPKDIILATPEEVSRDQNRSGTLIQMALQEGQVLYERV